MLRPKILGDFLQFQFFLEEAPADFACLCMKKHRPLCAICVSALYMPHMLVC